MVLGMKQLFSIRSSSMKQQSESMREPATILPLCICTGSIERWAKLTNNLKRQSHKDITPILELREQMLKCYRIFKYNAENKSWRCLCVTEHLGLRELSQCFTSSWNNGVLDGNDNNVFIGKSPFCEHFDTKISCLKNKTKNGVTSLCHWPLNLLLLWVKN